LSFNVPNESTRVIFVQLEHVISKKFLALCHQLGQWLGRFLVDECHLPIEHQDFRIATSTLIPALSTFVQCQRIYAMAALPWKMQSQFLAMTSIGQGPDSIGIAPRLLSKPNIPPNKWQRQD
jgi:hypothetical protein